MTLHLSRPSLPGGGGGEDPEEASPSTSESTSVREGEDVRLKCLADANPDVHTVQWMYEVRSHTEEVKSISKVFFISKLLKIAIYRGGKGKCA